MSLTTLSTTLRPRSPQIAPSSVPVPSSTGSAPSGNNSNGNSGNSSSSNGTSVYGYYFLFLIILLCLLGLLCYFCYRRRQRRTLQTRHSALQQHLRQGPFAESAAARGAGMPAPVMPRARQRGGAAGWWRGPPREREEGLNEQGEAPPAYVPKPREEGQEAGIPLETMARGDDVGAKPPDYYGEVREVSGEERREGGSAASSSRGPGGRATAT